MQWLRRHGWWGLLVVALILVFFGVTDIAGGPAADPAIPLGLTGQTIEELEAESAAAYAVFDFHTRSNGWTVVIFGTLLAIITLVPYRRGERRAWRTMWVLPVWLAGVAVSYIIAGVTARPTIDSRMHRPRVRRA
jgi:ABC-type Fe3+-siderophore transport system permease subunit